MSKIKKAALSILFFVVLLSVVLVAIINGKAAEASINYVKSESVAICAGEKLASVRVKIFPLRIKVVGDSGYAEFSLSARCHSDHSVHVKTSLKKKVGRWCVTDSFFNGVVRRNLDFCEK